MDKVQDVIDQAVGLIVTAFIVLTVFVVVTELNTYLQGVGI